MKVSTNADKAANDAACQQNLSFDSTHLIKLSGPWISLGQFKKQWVMSQLCVSTGKKHIFKEWVLIIDGWKEVATIKSNNIQVLS